MEACTSGSTILPLPPLWSSRPEKIRMLSIYLWAMLSPIWPFPRQYLFTPIFHCLHHYTSWENYIQVRKSQDGHLWNKLPPGCKGVQHNCIISPYLFNLYVDYILREAGVEEECGLKLNEETSVTCTDHRNQAGDIILIDEIQRN